MTRVTEKFLDLLRDPRWTTPSWGTTTGMIISAEEEISIIPETEHGPMLQIASKDENGVVIHLTRMNLAAVDQRISELIKMRDHMVQMKERSDT